MYGMGESAYSAALAAEGWDHVRAAFVQWRQRRRREREVATLESWFRLTPEIHPGSPAPQIEQTDR